MGRRGEERLRGRRICIKLLNVQGLTQEKSTEMLDIVERV